MFRTRRQPLAEIEPRPKGESIICDVRKKFRPVSTQRSVASFRSAKERRTICQRRSAATLHRRLSVTRNGLDSVTLDSSLAPFPAKGSRGHARLFRLSDRCTLPPIFAHNFLRESVSAEFTPPPLSSLPPCFASRVRTFWPLAKINSCFSDGPPRSHLDRFLRSRLHQRYLKTFRRDATWQKSLSFHPAKMFFYPHEEKKHSQI